MEKLILPIAILVVLAVAIKALDLFLRSRKPRFDYTRKDSLMTPAERECFNALVAEMGQDYYFFPQIHLDAILDPVHSPRDRFYAFRHINQKSVDFVACDKSDLRPLFAIEVDDKTHRQAKRQERDREVERVLHGAGIPLIRIENRGRFDGKELAEIIRRGVDRFSGTSHS
jgi:hypothetical protein